MSSTTPKYTVTKRRELMVRVARDPRFSCGCIKLSPEDRFRARRVFRMSRNVVGSWEQERKDRGVIPPSAPPPYQPPA